MCQPYLLQGLAPSTRKTYSSAQRLFINFCEMTGRVHPNVSPFPTEEWTLCLFATQLSASLQPPTIKVYLSAVRSLRIERGYADPLKDCLRLQHVVKGIKRCKGSSLDRRLPITPHILRNLFSGLNLSNFDDLMFWGACCLAFFGFLRSAEFTLQPGTVFSSSHHLSVADVTVDRRNNPSSIQVCIKASKTDPFRNGCLITLGRGLPPVCPVEAMLNYLELRGGHSGPLFIYSNGRPLSRSFLTGKLRKLLDAAGITGYFGSHSFRIGAATTAAAAGVPDHLIQVLGRSTSNAYMPYIRTPRSTLANVAKFMC